jgi:hypothetical protein
MTVENFETHYYYYYMKMISRPWITHDSKKILKLTIIIIVRKKTRRPGKDAELFLVECGSEIRAGQGEGFPATPGPMCNH